MQKNKIPFKKGDIAKLYSSLIVVEYINLGYYEPQIVFRFYGIDNCPLYHTEIRHVTALNQEIVKILYTK
jgi:hypothetical protein